MTEFLAWEVDQELRAEYVDGDVRTLGGQNVRHARLVSILAFRLGRHLDGTRCRLYTTSFGVMLKSERAFYYPDLQVVCAEDCEVPWTDEDRANKDPRLIIQLLTNATASVDLGDKLTNYRTIKSLREYVVVNYRTLQASVWRRAGNGWADAQEVAPTEPLRLESIALTVTMRELMPSED